MAKKTKTEVADQPTMASGVEQDAVAPVIEAPMTEAPTPASKPKKAKKPKSDITLEELCARYIAHLDEAGKSQGTLFSYRLELTTALDELGKDTPLSTLTPARVLEFFTSDRVMKSRTVSRRRGRRFSRRSGCCGSRSCGLRRLGWLSERRCRKTPRRTDHAPRDHDRADSPSGASARFVGALRSRAVACTGECELAGDYCNFSPAA